MAAHGLKHNQLWQYSTENRKQTFADDTEEENTLAVMHFLGAKLQKVFFSGILLGTRKGVRPRLCYILLMVQTKYIGSRLRFG